MTHGKKTKKQKNDVTPTIIDQIKNTLSNVWVVWKQPKGHDDLQWDIYGIFSAEEIAQKCIEMEQVRTPEAEFSVGTFVLDYRWHHTKPIVKYWRPK